MLNIDCLILSLNCQNKLLSVSVSVSVYDNWWLVAYASHVSKSFCIPAELSAIKHKSSASHEWLIRLSPRDPPISE